MAQFYEWKELGNPQNIGMKSGIKVIKAIGNIVGILALFIVGQLIGNIIGGIMPVPWMGDVVGTMIRIIVTLILGALYGKYILRINLSELGVKKRAPELKWVIVGIVLPILISTFYLVFIEGQLVKNDRITTIFPTLISAIFLAGIGAGIVEEFVFRGLIMKMLEKYFGKVCAITLPSLLFGFVHLLNYSSWNLLDAVILVIAGTMVGIMFSLIAYQSTIIWSSAVVHGLWNVIIIGGILEISGGDHGMSIGSIWQYKLSASSFLLTGGQFGIEAALPATIGYVFVSILALYYLKKSNRYLKALKQVEDNHFLSTY